MQIPSSPATAQAPLSLAGRPVAGANVLETRSTVLPAVQQPTEIQGSINQRNPANRPTLVDEEVRLYGPFTQAAAPSADPVITEPVVPDVVVDDQPQGQQSQQQEADDASADADVTAAAGDSEVETTIARAGQATTEDSAQRESDNRQDNNQAGSEQQEKAEARAERIRNAEQEQVAKLSARDREVRSHEAAHAAIGGQYAGGASFSMRQGPNGVNYAVSGEVPIDVSAIANDPEATIRKMQTVQRAALAPAEPSSADRAVAAQAAQIAQQARAQLQSDRGAERSSQVEQARAARVESAQKRSSIADRLSEIQNRFNFSAELVNAQRSRQIDIIAERYSPLRPGAIGTLFDETV